jgi:hypothetical protein
LRNWNQLFETASAFTIWIADAHRGDGKRFALRADELLPAFKGPSNIPSNAPAPWLPLLSPMSAPTKPPMAIQPTSINIHCFISFLFRS